MTIVRSSRRFGRRPALDGYGRQVRVHKAHVTAVAIRDGLMIAVIVHAVMTVLFSPRRKQ
jgi:hypothetical protein